MIFTSEKDVNESLPFLDVLTSRNKKDFTTRIYHKSTFSGIYFNFNSFIAHEYKHGLIFTLLFRIFSLVSDFSFPTNLVDKCIKIFLYKQFSQKILEYTVSKKELPYFGMPSLCLRTPLQKSINSNISFCKIEIIFKS